MSVSDPLQTVEMPGVGRGGQEQSLMMQQSDDAHAQVTQKNKHRIQVSATMISLLSSVRVEANSTVAGYYAWNQMFCYSEHHYSFLIEDPQATLPFEWHRRWNVFDATQRNGGSSYDC